MNQDLIEYLPIHFVLFIIGAIFLNVDEFDNKKYISKKTIFKNILLAMIPVYNVIISFSLIVFLISYAVAKSSIKETEEEKKLEDRENNVFGFLQYKGIDISELDDYIDSRKLIMRLNDRISK